MSKIKTRLDKIEERYNEINELMMDPSVLSDNKTLAKLGKEQSSIAKTVEVYQKYKKVTQEIEETKELIELEEDYDMKAMAKEELETLEKAETDYLGELEVLLIEKDPNDECNAIIEIRGAAGGDEGNIFAGDLYRMYIRYAETIGWKIEILEIQEADAGGYSLISFILKGERAYGRLKFESGSHRVQRVPKTESQGRIHTSTATVLVTPELDEVEIEINPNDLEIDTLRASGAGGQHVNKTDSAVRITHVPTGISVKCQDGRSQHDNRDKAMKLIRQRIFEHFQNEKDAEIGADRKNKIGTGDRSEKIRTYNYPQNRVTDHRIGLTIQQLDRIMEGKLQEILDALEAADQAARLAGENDAI